MRSTSTTVNSTQDKSINDSIDGGDTSQNNSSSDPSRIAAIRELIETEQRYVDDLLIVANEFIQPLNNARILNDYEINQIFINWYNLIALNSNLLQAFHEQVNYKEHTHSSENEVLMRTPRSVSMSNLAIAALVCITKNKKFLFLLLFF